MTSSRCNRNGASQKSVNKTKGNMETQRNSNAPGKPSGPGQQGVQEQDRESLSANSASVKDKAVAASRMAASSKADDKSDCIGLVLMAEATPAVLLVR
jgi:hypothetical protein